jgi:hypothetical protein
VSSILAAGRTGAGVLGQPARHAITRAVAAKAQRRPIIVRIVLAERAQTTRSPRGSREILGEFSVDNPLASAANA